VQQSQRIAIKTLTSTLAKLVNDNEISNLNIEEFIPSRTEDKMSWYLDLLETQLKLTNDMISDLKEYEQSMKGSEICQNTKQLKAAYYELASNTKFVSDQVSAISNTFDLIKNDFELRILNSANERAQISEYEIEKENVNLQNIAHIQPSRYSFESRLMDTTVLKQIENLKNELNLTNKIKTSLEKQLQVYKKENTSQATESQKKIEQLIQDLESTRDELREEINSNDVISHKLKKNENIIGKALNYCTETFKKEKSELKEKLDEAEKKHSETQKELKALQKPSLEQMRREIFASKSKQRDNENQMKDLKQRIIDLEKENEKQKESISELKKTKKELKQDLDLQNKQSFRIVQSERDELEEKLRQEIRQRVIFSIIRSKSMQKNGLPKKPN
jgi:chromosome segregation ATPase